MDFRKIVDLPQLETLSSTVDRYHVSHWNSRSHKLTVCVPSATQFPSKLKKLKLVGTRLAWEDLNIIGHWPNLEVLKLKPNACRGLEWRPIEGGFQLNARRNTTIHRNLQVSNIRDVQVNKETKREVVHQENINRRMAPENLNDFSVSSRQWFFSSLVQFCAKALMKMDHVKSIITS
ncbi:hypothetical protein BC332_24522 [Capsicum chinense]|nr:hypothetical protein BC332_24522 [Capsicum chinense]